MKVLLVVCLVCLPSIFARFAFPVRVGIEVQNIFRKINPSIKWDSTSFLVDESGPYTTCVIGLTPGRIPLPKLTEEYLRSHGVMETVGGLTDNIRMTGPTKSGATKDILSMAEKWTENSPFSEQIRVAHKFGCSVLPGCGSKTVMTCIFTPAYQGQGDQPQQGGDDLLLGSKSRPVAFTEDQYKDTEKMFRKRNRETSWDRSFFLENLSAETNACGMIGKTQWNYEKVQKKARKYKKGPVGLLFGWANRSGNTDRDVQTITSRWLRTREGLKQIARAKRVGCSLIQECGNGQTVVACLVNPGA